MSQFHGFKYYHFGGIDEDYGPDNNDDVGPSERSELLQEANLKSWQHHFGKGILKADIQEAIYGKLLQDLPFDGEDPFHLHPKVQKTKHPNGLVQQWQAGKLLDEFNYMRFAKACEPYCTAYGRWGEVKEDSHITEELRQEAQRRYASTKIPFLKLRYAYQLVRLAQFHQKYDDAIRYYHKYAKPVLWASKEIGAWVTGNYAGCLRQKKRYAEAAYAFSRVYASAPSRQIEARWGWKINDDKQWNQLMALCKNDREKADNHTLRAFSLHAIPYEDIRMMQQLDPGREDLDLLIVREINNIEIEILGPISFSSRDYAAEISDQRSATYAHKRVSELDAILVDGLAKHQTFDSTLWQLSHIYLRFLNGHFEESKNALAALKPHLWGEDLMRAQKMHLEMQMVTTKQVTPAMEESLALSAIDKRGWKPEEIPRFIHFRDDALFWKYIAQGDELKAVLIKSPQELLERYNVRSSLIDSIFGLEAKPNKTALEAEMITRLWKGIDDHCEGSSYFGGFKRENLLEMKGTALLTEGKLDEAIAVFSSLPPKYLGGNDEDLFRPWIKQPCCKLEEDPFRPWINREISDNPLWKDRRYNKLTFTKTLKSLINQTKLHDGKNHLRYLIIGNAHFNTLTAQMASTMKGYGANAEWMRPHQTVFYELHNIEGHKVMLWPRNIDTRPAVSYYEKSIAATDDPEYQALAYYMIARCERMKNHWITKIVLETKGEKAAEPYEKIEHLSPTFAILRDRYGDTEIVDMLLKECWDFNRYCSQ